MPDMLVKLYALPDAQPVYQKLAAEGIDIRRALAPERHVVLAWVRATFGEFWVSETEIAYSNRPISCWVATDDGLCVGFGCYDATQRGFFGPTGVNESMRGKGVGKALLLACLHDMRSQGYGYAVIGGVGPIDFYATCVGAVLIPDSDPGIYRGMLRPKE